MLPPTARTLAAADARRGVTRFLVFLAIRAQDGAAIFGILWAMVAAYDATWNSDYLIAAVAAVGLFLVFAEGVGVYRCENVAVSPLLLSPVANAWMWTGLALFVLAWMTKTTSDYSRVVVGVWMFAAPLAMMSIRICRYRLRQGPRERVVVVGSPQQAEEFGRMAASTAVARLDVLGFFDTEARSKRANGAVDGAPPFLGNLDSLIAQARARTFDAVYLALPMAEEAAIRHVVEELADTTVSVYVLPDAVIRDLLNSRWTTVARQPAVAVFESPHQGVNGVAKRLEDLVIGVLVVIVAAIPMLVIAAAIKATSRGPVIFNQRRYGLDGREFLIRKFSTMSVHQDGDRIPQARVGDPRVTPLGRFLRRSSLDELPQFFNVLRGDMSVVGPRPHAVAHNEHFRDRIPGYMRRHKIRPGITGWAQVNGWRGATDTVELMEGRLQCDLWYLRNWSIWLDLEILLRTPWAAWIAHRAKAF